MISNGTKSLIFHSMITTMTIIYAATHCIKWALIEDAYVKRWQDCVKFGKWVTADGTGKNTRQHGTEATVKLNFMISEYLQEHYTRCITRAVLLLKNVPGTF